MVTIGNMLQRIKEESVRPRTTTKLRYPIRVPRLRASLYYLTKDVDLPLQRVYYGNNSTTPSIVNPTVQRRFRRLNDRNNVVRVNQSVRIRLSLSAGKRYFFRQDTSRTSRVKPVIQLQLRRTTYLYGNNRGTFYAVTKRKNLQIVRGNTLPFYQLNVRDYFARVGLFDPTRKNKPYLRHFPTILPRRVNTRPLFQLFFLLRRRVGPFRRPISITIFRVILFTPHGTKLKRVVPTTSVRPTVNLYFLTRKNVDISNATGVIVMPYVSSVRQGLNVSKRVNWRLPPTLLPMNVYTTNNISPILVPIRHSAPRHFVRLIIKARTTTFRVIHYSQVTYVLRYPTDRRVITRRPLFVDQFRAINTVSHRRRSLSLK